MMGFIHLLNKPEIAYPKEALQQHIEGKVELELTVSPQGDVVSERVVLGPPALQQATMDAFKKLKYIPVLRDGQPSVAFVQAIVAYEKDHAVISTESDHASTINAASAINRASAVNRDAFGLGTGAHGRQMGNIEVLSDTQGVNFDPYLERVLHDVKMNWYSATPESAQKKHGNLVIEFAITRDGKVAGMKLVAPSRDAPLDRAAWAGIVGSNPFLPLPSEFSGQFLALRFRFFYNPTKEELAPAQQETALRQCVRDVLAKRRQDLDSNQNIIAELEHDAASLTSSLGDGSLSKLDETAARYYRAEAVGKLNAMRAIAGQIIDVRAAQQALDDFDKVIATDGGYSL
jgi:TonB family protein